uniref:Thymus, brain and testes associated n=1 Tax=Kryptolebias marmoratus TaxID=37003 RepID=A0A3Q3G8S5_KRYMA
MKTLRTYSQDAREATGGRSRSQVNLLLGAELSKLLTRSSPHLGALGHPSFFSRHNPHPHRVRHIQGLNGRPICTVKDDWFVTSSLFPHPLLKSNVFRKSAKSALGFPFGHNFYGANGNKNKSALFSEAWRDELKELAVKVSLLKEMLCIVFKVQPEEELVRRKTQYSSETGRIIPRSSTSCQHKHQHRKYPQPFHDQELMVLELLCQILQTDSLSAVQQWLLLAGQREYSYFTEGFLKKRQS